ncbi:MAG TPA: peptidoglycan-binding domain-containing protein [Elainellaceae cyanobacterium]|jgi:peptidoglycan hydrolase-like protein with peptidoglycan-binding domain
MDTRADRYKFLEFLLPKPALLRNASNIQPSLRAGVRNLVSGRLLLSVILPAAIWATLGIMTPVNAQLILERGETGPAVETLQQQLQDRGYFVNVDGVFGQMTEDALIQFQRDAGLAPDGIYGPATESALFGFPQSASPAFTNASFTDTSFPPADSPYINASPGSRTLFPSDRGSDVEALQRELNARGYSTGGTDGIYGPSTESAVRSFQSFQGLSADGVTGPATWRALGFTPSDPFPPIGFPSDPGTSSSGGLTVFGLPRQGPYIVSVPADRDDVEELRQAQRVVTGASFAGSSRGLFIFAGAYSSRAEAEEISLRLRSLELDSRVEYFRNEIILR